MFYSFFIFVLRVTGLFFTDAADAITCSVSATHEL